MPAPDPRRQLGQFGVWRGSGLVDAELAVTIERCGYGALWLGGSPSGDLRIADELLAATSTLTVATGIVNIWQDPPATVAASYARIESRFPGRFLLGIGAGHREATRQYARPFEAMTGYVSALLAAGVPPGRLVLAALGPRMLRLAAEQAGGAHPYLVPAGYTRQARSVLGPGPLLAPEHKAVLAADPQQARAIGRARVATPYLGLANYTANLRRLGWSEADLAGGGSDALIDALVAHGTAAQAAARLREHLEAGADHVCVQLLTADAAGLAAGYRELAAALGL